MQIFQIVASGVVINSVLWDGVAPLPLATGQQAVASSTAAIGWSYANGVFTPPAAPALTAAQLQAYAGSKASALLATMRAYTAGGATLKSDAIASTIANLLALSQWGASNPTASENWVANDFSTTPITGAQFVALAPLVGAYAQAIYGTQLAAVLAEIAAGTITTTAQIDAYAWTV